MILYIVKSTLLGILYCVQISASKRKDAPL